MKTKVDETVSVENLTYFVLFSETQQNYLPKNTSKLNIDTQRMIDNNANRIAGFIMSPQ